MGRKCEVCQHKDRLEIDRQLVRNGNASALSKKYDLPKGSLHRHLRKHLSRQLVKAHDTKEILHGKGLVTELTALFEKAKAILEKAEDAGSLGVALKGVAESRNTIELLAKLAAYVHEEGKKVEEEDSRARIDNLKNLTIGELEALNSLMSKMESGSHDAIDVTPLDKPSLEKLAFDKFEPTMKLCKPRRKPLTFSDDDEDDEDEDDFRLDTPDPKPVDDEEEEDDLKHQTRPSREIAGITPALLRLKKGGRTRRRSFLDDAVKGSVRVRTLK
jgi:hypothetical protein